MKFRTIGAVLFCAMLLTSTFGNSASADEFNGLPNSSRTPGATNGLITESNIAKTICVSGWTKTERPPTSYTNALKTGQLLEGYALNGDTMLADYEEDHLVPLELGGDPTSPLNLWPELWAGSRGAHVKDALENKLHSLVCSKKLSLTAAQLVFELDWVAGYAKYVGTLQPQRVSTSPTTETTSTPSPSSTPSVSPSDSVSPTPKPVPSPKASPTHWPTGTTALCIDGTFSYSITRTGSCSDHDGVAVWNESATSSPTPSPSVTSPTPSPSVTSPTPSPSVTSPTPSPSVSFLTNSGMCHVHGYVRKNGTVVSGYYRRC